VVRIARYQSQITCANVPTFHLVVETGWFWDRNALNFCQINIQKQINILTLIIWIIFVCLIGLKKKLGNFKAAISC